MGAIKMLCNRGLVIEKGMTKFDGDVKTAIGNYSRSFENSSFDIIDEDKRSGNGTIKITRIEIRGADNHKNTVIQSGEAINLFFYLNKFLPGSSVQFTIYDQQGLAISTFNSSQKGSTDCEDPTLDNAFVCHFDELPLVPGRYRINTALSTLSGIEDHVDGAFYFSVQSGRINGRMVKEDNKYGSVHIRHNWIKPQ